MQKLEKLKTELEGIDIRFNEPLFPRPDDPGKR